LDGVKKEDRRKKQPAEWVRKENLYVEEVHMLLRKLGVLIACLGVLALCILISGCSTSKPSGPSIPIETLLSAPEQVEIDGRTYVLETCMWRDFMPFCPPDGKPLIAIIWVTAIDSLQFPSSVDADWLWVIKDKELWRTKFTNEQRGSYYGYKLEKVARDGPRWGPKIQVDVAVRLVDRENKTYLLKASNQWIGRTD